MEGSSFNHFKGECEGGERSLEELVRFLDNVAQKL